jgi:hypothetical protein
MVSVLLAIPNTGNLRTETTYWLLHEQLNFGNENDLTIILPNSIPHDSNRNTIVEMFKMIGSDYLLMVDSDIAPEIRKNESFIQKMIDREKDILSANIHSFNDPYIFKVGMIFNKKKELVSVSDDATGLKEVDAVGTGCILISKKVINSFKEPLFRFEYDKLGRMNTSEDFHFCKLAKKLGFKIWYDNDLETLHYRTINI